MFSASYFHFIWDSFPAHINCTVLFGSRLIKNILIQNVTLCSIEQHDKLCFRPTARESSIYIVSIISLHFHFKIFYFQYLYLDRMKSFYGNQQSWCHSNMIGSTKAWFSIYHDSINYIATVIKSRPPIAVHGANMGPTWVLSAPDGPHELCYQGLLPTEIS